MTVRAIAFCFACVLAGCATAPQESAVTAGGIDLPVRWVRSDAPRAEVKDGVCVLSFPDVRSGDVPIADDLASSCIAKGGLHAPTDATGVMRVRWHRDESNVDLNQAYVDLNGGASYWVAAFVHRSGDVCHIFTRKGDENFGHELKHCYDGSYHL